MAHTLMIVDDSNVIRNRISRNSTEHFEVVATATNGKEALDKYKQLRPNVVTMDLTMPEMDGLMCISEIIGFDENANILVISALSDKATGIKALELGARGFICKPFTDEDLASALHEMITE